MVAKYHELHSLLKSKQYYATNNSGLLTNKTNEII